MLCCTVTFSGLTEWSKLSCRVLAITRSTDRVLENSAYWTNNFCWAFGRVQVAFHMTSITSMSTLSWHGFIAKLTVSGLVGLEPSTRIWLKPKFSTRFCFIRLAHCLIGLSTPKIWLHIREQPEKSGCISKFLNQNGQSNLSLSDFGFFWYLSSQAYMSSSSQSQPLLASDILFGCEIMAHLYWSPIHL